MLWAADRAANSVRQQFETEILRRLPAAGSLPQNKAAMSLVIDRFMSEHREEIEKQTAAMAERTREDLTYSARGEGLLPYLVGYDSYLWLRYARDRLRTGSPCEAVVNGECRDTLTLAPYGAASLYAQRLHPLAIARLHALITTWKPEYPLQASAYWLSVLLGTLAVIPAFFLGRRLGGTVGGLFAGAFTAGHPAVLARTMNGDNDVWNLILPLFAAWALVAGLKTKRTYASPAYAGAVSILIGLQAWAWSGWLFLYVIVLASCSGMLLLEAIRHFRQRKDTSIRLASSLLRLTIIIVVIYFGSAITTLPSVSPKQYFGVPVALFGAVQRAATGEHESSTRDIQWPSALDTVAELAPMHLLDIARNLGGVFVLVLALFGAVVIALPRRKWKPVDLALVAGNGLTFFFLLRQPSGSLMTACGLALLPLAVLIFMTLRGELELPGQGAAWLLILWLSAALYLALNSTRFMLLLAPAIALTAAAAIGKATTLALEYAETGSRWYRRVTYAAVAAVVAIIVLSPIGWGNTFAREYAPEMNDAWWDSLTHLRKQTPKDAIVHVLWDYGHWVTYVAERGVDNDGTSLQTHVPVWVAKALLTQKEEESAGILRMLGCGSDPARQVPGEMGAYERLRGFLKDSAATYKSLIELASLDRERAEAYLTQRGIDASGRRGILQLTHCVTPESYLVLSSRMVDKRAAWLKLGSWAPSQHVNAGFANNSATIAHPPVEPFIASWLPCEQKADSDSLSCEIKREIQPRPESFGTFLLNAAGSPTLKAQLRRKRLEGPPEIFIRAGEQGMEERHFADSPYPNLGVLFDSESKRILIGAPSLLRSTFIQLMYLDGRYSKRYMKFDERAAGERVIIWKLLEGGKP